MSANNKLLNIVIPMAGRGSRFAKVGYSQPKPLIPAHGMPMIELVIKNLTPNIPHRFVFICQKEHLENLNLREIFKKSTTNYEVISLDYITEGAAKTVMLAEKFINNDNPLMIANCDQYISTDINKYLNKLENEKLDGLIMTMTADDPKWSFVGLENNMVHKVVEKEVISKEATVGIYNFKSGRDFVNAALEMFKNNDKTNNEYYVAPAYNYMIKNGSKIGYLNIGSERNGMYGLGIPEDLDFFNSLSEIPRN